MPTTEKTLYLTFDDGPVPGPTEFVLSTLKHFDAKATFFCIGDNVRKHPGILSLVAEGGHRIGNHTYHHLKGWATPTSRYVENVQRCTSELKEHLPDQSCRFFRPPYGRITRSQIKALSPYKIVMWDVLSMDYDQQIAADRCLRRTIGAVRNGSIIVFHDSLKAEKNLVSVLPKFVDHFSSLGYTFKSLPE